ncbi:hypothetical protein NMY3_00548 [Candidatus Nitrosocosmicus oleophilus]|uniref:Uncharacterized protein n=1 Tax=Candidatus Nitrosocosmicus oleophilus TaxID=1353260 RepID=A0A654LVC9_9ARCH|nr:hypothetical protein [Candidatus Nitrosocosmicus oleophilus]ALI34760.1 hypothetical protein NMY3_00548 [Candidatus Nitrosocosmicus oleophilus]
MDFSIEKVIHDENFSCKTQTIQLGQKQISTPIRALHLKDPRSESRIIKENKLRGINEIHINLSNSKFHKIKNDTKENSRFSQSINNLVRKHGQNDINFLIVNFDIADKIDSENIDYLANELCTPYNEIVIPPIVSGLDLDQLKLYLRRFYDSVRNIRDDPVFFGFFPILAPVEFKELCRFYYDNKITNFMLDCHGKNPLDFYSLMNDLKRLSKSINEKYEIDTFIHALNVPFTRIQKKRDVAPAKDIMAYVMGFDSFGSSHVQRPLPPDLQLKLKEEKDIEDFHIFDGIDYGYHKTSMDEFRITTDKKNTSIDKKYLDDFSDNTKKMIKIYNAERHGYEALEIRKHIRNRSLIDHMDSKVQAKDSLEYIQKKLIR